MDLTGLLWLVLDYVTPFQAALATSALLFYLVYIFLKDNDMPPGPIGLPVLGYWPFLNAEKCHVQLKDMVRKYGEVYSFRVTGQLFVHLGSIRAVKESQVTKGDCFAGRFTTYSVLSFLFQEGIAIVNGEPWKVLRKFFLQKFKEYGMGAVKDNATGFIQDALQETMDELHSSKGQPLAITDLVTEKCLLIIRRILFNDQGITRQELQELNDEYSIVMGGMKSKTFLLMGNLARYCIFPLMPVSWRMKRSQKRIDAILMDIVIRHKKAYDESQVIDIVDCYIKERDDRRKRGDLTADYFTDKALASSLSQFITDGVLTVGLFIGTFLLSLVEHPEEQEKMYQELMDVIGPERLPTIEDKTKLPYTNAFMYEVMRFTDFFPLYPSLECSKETELQGIPIPKGAVTIVNLYAAHRDPNTFHDPEIFDPSRYLSSPDKPREELPILFGVGKRSCIGEAFTMIQAFLFLATIVKSFRLDIPEKDKGSSITFWSQERIKICAIPRSQK